MKKLIKKIKDKVSEFFRWVWKECKDWHTIAILGFVSMVLSTPIWLCYLLGFIFDWSWAFWVATGVWGFWMLPGAPFFAVAVSITLGIRRLFEKKSKKQDNEGSDDEEKDK